jgi:hypothetical protein
MSNRVLLTGAGFTHNFGTPLAEGMWSLIFNNKAIQSNGRLVNILKDKFNYEDIYQKVIYSDEYSEDEKSIFTKAIKDAYFKIDNSIRQPINLGQTLYRLYDMLMYFTKNRGGPAYFFTLNQDLFVERKIILTGLSLILPGLVSRSLNNFKNITDTNLATNPGLFTTIPDTPIEVKIEKQEYYKFKNTSMLSYVKLHGSTDWISKSNANHLILGTSKSEQIRKHPLLSWYFQLFEEQLNQPETKLLIIGYGFSDNHINKIIAKAIDKYKLTLHLISPIDKNKYKKKLQQTKSGKLIWEGISGFYPYSLTKIFPFEPLWPTQAWQELENNFFNK